MFLSIGMLKLNYFLADIFILSAEKQPIKLSWRKIEWLHISHYLLPFERLCVLHNISQFSIDVAPPLLHAVTWSASISLSL